jgi:hypothetical protein
MTTILSMIKRVQSFDVTKAAAEAMEEAAPLLTDRQKDQLLEGKNAKGQKIGRYRNPAYARMKAAMNPVPGLGVPDLKLTGDFWKGIYVDIRGDRVIIDSVDEKTQDLVDKYSEAIFGLNKNTKAEFVREDLRPVFIKTVREKLKL